MACNALTGVIPSNFFMVADGIKIANVWPASSDSGEGLCVQCLSRAFIGRSHPPPLFNRRAYGYQSSGLCDLCTGAVTDSTAQQENCASLSISTNVYSALQLQLLLAPTKQVSGDASNYLAQGQALPGDVIIYRHLRLLDGGLTLQGDVARPDPVGNGAFNVAATVRIHGDTSSCIANAVSYLPGDETWRSSAQFSLCTLDVGVQATTGHFSVTGVALELFELALIGGVGWRMLGGAVYVAPTGSLLATNCFFGYNTALLGGALYGDIFYTKPIGPSTSTSDIGLEADYNLHTATEDFITAGSPSPGDFANITTTNCTFLQNTATVAGGAVFVQMHFSSYNSLFLNNSVPADVNNAGGAISGSLRLGTLTLVGNTYEQNFAPKAGAVSVGGGLISFDETYRDNRAADGAAIVFWSERRMQTIARGTFTGNVVTRDAQVQSTDQSNTGSGGAIWSSPGSRMSIINTTFSNNSAQNGGGALRGSAFNVTGCTFTNNSALSNPPFGFIPGGGGAIQMIGDLPASPSGASAVFGSVFVNNTSASSYGGAIQVMYGSAAPSVPPTITISSSRLSGNTAVNGGAIAVQGDMLLQFMDTVCLANSASADGGCLYAASGIRSAQISHCVLAGNTAGHVGGSAFISGANVTMLSTNISSSTATSGGGVYLTQCAATASSLQLAQNVVPAFGGAFYLEASSLSDSPNISSIRLTSNTAQVGAAVFIDPSSSSNISYASSSGGGNVASNYGAVAATLPTSFCLFTSAGPQLIGATYKSGVPLGLGVLLYDALNQSVASWPDFTADVMCLSQLALNAPSMSCAPSSLIGNTHAVYASSSAAFPALALSGSVGTIFTLSVTLASPTIPVFGAAGRRAVVNVTIAPCDPLQVFQNLRCVCAPGAFLNGTSQQCQTCSPGSYSPAPGAVACTVNPPGFASSTQTTFASTVTLAGVSAGSFGAAQNSTLTATLAATLNAPASIIAITAVTSAAPSGRHLLQASAAVAFSVATANATQASSLRSALSATVALAASLSTALRGSADPVLSAVTGVVAAPAAETNLVLAALPCPAGTFLNGLTQSCDQCAVGLVATSTGSTTCSKCPPRFAWVNSSLCSPCPDSSVTSPGNPAQCACSSGFYDSRFGASLAEPVCKACPLGGACDTGLVGAAAGYWRENDQSDTFVQCREGNCLEETVLGPLSMLMAPPAGNGTLSAGHNCVDGNSGPLCGVCIPGYAMQSGVCAPCDPADAWDNWNPGSKAGLLIGCIIFALIALSFLFFQPLVPSLERSSVAILAAIKAVPSYVLANLYACCCCCFVKRSQPVPVEEKEAKTIRRTSKTSGVSEEHKEHTVVADKKKKDGEPDAAADFARNGNIALAAGNVAAFSGGGDAGSGDDDAESSEEGGDGGGAAAGQGNEEVSDGDSSGGGVEGNLDFFDWLEEFTEKLEKISKVVIKCARFVICLASALLSQLTRLPLHNTLALQLLSGTHGGAAARRAWVASDPPRVLRRS